MSDPRLSDSAALSPSKAQRLDQVCERFEAAWKAGQRPPIEAFLEGVPAEEQPRLLFALVGLEMGHRRQAGEPFTAEEYRARFSAFDLGLLTTAAAPAQANVPAARPAAPPPLAPGATRIRCPHCHNPILLVDDRPDEVLCPGCGSSFRVREARQTTTAGTMRPLGKFQLLERVGLGAFGAVWRAKDTELDRIVALKIPHASLLTSEDDLERFHREARAAAQLRHPGIVTVHEVQTLEGLPTIVADFIDGVPLRGLLEVRRLTFREAAALVADVAEAVDYAHGMGLIHRDLKPANIMMDYGRPRLDTEDKGGSALNGAPGGLGKSLVMDFGLALRDEAEVTMTLDGHIIGTPAYMSPEQAAGKSHQADRRSDVYSLGVVLYELLTGELPFRGSRMMLLHQVLREEPRPPRKVNDKIPRDLETICLKALAKAPGQRYPTARELAEDLRSYLKGEPIKARPVGAAERAWRWARRRPAAAGLVAASGLAAVALVGALVAVAFTVRLNDAKERAEQAQQEEEKQRQLAEEYSSEANKQRGRAERYLYASDMNLAHGAWHDAQIPRMRELLERQRPQRPQQEDLRGFEWHYLWHLCHSELFCLRGHTSPFMSVAFSPDGQRLAIAGDTTVRVWDATSGQEVLALKGHTGAVLSVAFSPDGQRLATASDDMMVKVWETALPTAEIVVQRQATRLVSGLFATLRMQEEVLEQLRRDPFLSTPLRAAALAYAPRFRYIPTPERLNYASWDVVRQPGMAASAYQRAMRQAREACRLAPDDGLCLNTLGVAHYRVRELVEAVTILTQSDKRNRVTWKDSHAADLAFLTMAYHKLGQKAQAQAMLARLRASMKKPEWAANAEVQGFLQEAEALLQGPPPGKKP